MSSISKPLAIVVQMLMISGALAGLMTGTGADEGKAGGRVVTLIHDVYELQNMSLDLNGSYELANDIDASATVNWNNGSGFNPVGPGNAYCFNGSLDGKNHVISGLFVNRPNTDNVGLLGVIDSGDVVKNIGIVDENVTGRYEIGGLAGMCWGSVDNAYATGVVNGVDCVGGLIGWNINSTVDNSYAAVNVNGNRDYSVAGGLVARNDGGRVNNSHATGNVTGRCGVGGLVGYNDDWYGDIATVNNSYATGDVVGTGWEIGGLVGEVLSGTVDNSYATGNVTGNEDNVGGLVGLISDYNGNPGSVFNSYATGNVTGNAKVGGLAGYNSPGAGDATVTNSYATGNVNGTSEVGGLAGNNSGTVNNTYAVGNVNGGRLVGGLVGNNSIGTVDNSYSAGYVTGGDDIGGLVGGNDGTVSNCFWDNETSGQNSSAGGTGKDTAEMKTLSTFTDAGWDFDNIWRIIENETYPYLRNVSVPPANHAPTITTSPVTNVTADSLYSVQFQASDPDGDSLSWNMSSNASWLNMAAAGLLSGTPSSADIGTYIVAITVSDGNGGTDSLTFELSVSAKHLISWTDVPVDANLTEGDNYTFTAKAADTYPELTLAYSVTSAENCTLTVNSSTGAIQWFNVTAGNYSFTLSATDGELTITHDFVLSVAKKHTISWTEVPVNANLTEGDNYTFTAKAADTYPEHALAYSVTSAENCTLTVNSTTGAIQWLNVTAGTYSFTLSVTDGELTIDHDFVLSVAKKHTISWTEVPGDTDLTEGDNYTFTAGAIDSYPELTLAYSVTSAENSTMTINSSTGTIQWLNVTAGNYSFTLSATDGELAISHDFILSVAKKPEPYLAPYIISVTGPENITVKASSVQTFSVEATSPSGANLTYAWQENGVTLATNKTFSHKFPPGNHTLILLIGDGRYTTTRTFNFTVAPPPKTISAKPASIPGFETGIAAAAIVTVVVIGLFWRRERR